MIGVIADPSEQDVVREFFELFKTPGSFTAAVGTTRLCSVPDMAFDGTAKLVLLYAGRKTRFDDNRRSRLAANGSTTCVLCIEGNRIPIYGDTVTFPEKGNGLLADEDSQQCAGVSGSVGGTSAGPDRL